jgi:hypothetical protein
VAVLVKRMTHKGVEQDWSKEYVHFHRKFARIKLFFGQNGEKVDDIEKSGSLAPSQPYPKLFLLVKLT